MQNLQQAYAEMFAAYPHETFVTLRFEHDRVSDEQALKCFQDFLRRVGKNHRTVVAGWAVLNRLQHLHAHLVLFGRSHSIKSLDTPEAERHWRYGTAHAQPYIDDGASIYLAINMTVNAPDKFLVMPLGINILKKFRRVT